MTTETKAQWRDDNGYRCPECGGDHLKVYAEESKIVYINAEGEVTDEQSGSNTEFIGPFECCDCRHEWDYPTWHPALDEGKE